MEVAKETDKDVIPMLTVSVVGTNAEIQSATEPAVHEQCQVLDLQKKSKKQSIKHGFK